MRILAVFNEFYGEDKVDMQGYPLLSEVESALPDNASASAVTSYISEWQSNNNTPHFFILVHFPHVRITNEHNRSVDINHLYAKVEFDIDGKMFGRFTLNRSDYTLLHLQNDYMHSHVSSIPFGCLSAFQSPCTGTGPINNTICSLARDFDEDIWRLFCLELERYVHVESLEGVPYHRLEGLAPHGTTYIDIGGTLNARNRFPMLTRDGIRYIPKFAEFTKYLIDKGKLKFSYIDYQYKLAMAPTQAVIYISNLFIEWYNHMFNESSTTDTFQTLKEKNILLTCKFTDGKLKQPYGRGGRNRDYSSYVGTVMFTFKGEPVRFTISGEAESTDENNVTVLNPIFTEYILTKVINVINFRYGNERKEDSAHKAICFF